MIIALWITSLFKLRYNCQTKMKKSYESPDLRFMQSRFVSLLCASTTSGTDPVTQEDFDFEWE